MGLKDESALTNDPNEVGEDGSQESVDELLEVDSNPETGDPSVEEEDEDEETEDPQETLRTQCADNCKKYKEELDVCTDRVTSRENTAETCEQELFDFLHCVDACVAPKLFAKLK